MSWAIRCCLRLMFVEYDRSALVRIEPRDLPVNSFSNWPILNGPLPFTTFGGVTVPNVHTESVVGFLVGEPIFVPKPEKLGLDGWTKGHFAYAVIHWDKYQEVKALSDRGYYLQQVFLPNEEGQPQYNANTRFLHFSTGSTDQQGIADIITGPWAAFRYQPYKKHGLESTDLSYRRLTPQVHIIVWVDKQVRNIGKFVAKDKEGKNA